MTQILNDAGLNLIEKFEGCKLTAYQDVAGIWTIGYGHINDVQPGDTCTQDDAVAFLQNDVMDAEDFVNDAIGTVATTTNQFAAMVSLCYNIGRGNFRSSSVLRFHNQGNATNAAASFCYGIRLTSMVSSQ